MMIMEMFDDKNDLQQKIIDINKVLSHVLIFSFLVWIFVLFL